MNTELFNAIKKLDGDDRDKIMYFVNLLIKKEKYDKLKKDISNRRLEIESGETITHDDIWKQMNV